jgi:hypothetical protein
VSKVKDDDHRAHLNVGLVAIGGKHAVGLFYAKGKKSGTSGVFAESKGVAVSPLFAVGERLAIGGGGAMSVTGNAFAGVVTVAHGTAASGFFSFSWYGRASAPLFAFGDTGAYSLGLAVAEDGHAVSPFLSHGRVGISPLFARGGEKAYGGVFALSKGTSNSLLFAHGEDSANALLATGPREAKKRSLLQVLRKLVP